MTNGRRILVTVLIGAAALLYGISPIDFIPELITGPLGFVDDAAGIAGAAFAIYKLWSGRPGSVPPPAA